MPRMMLAAVAAMAACALPTLASAGTTNNDVIVDGRTGAVTRTIAVSIDDLNLTTGRGYRTADSRLNRAARNVCGYMPESIMPTKGDYRACYGSAIEGARSDLNALAKARSAG